MSLDNRLATEVGGVIDRFAKELIDLFRAVELEDLIALRAVSREKEPAVSPRQTTGPARPSARRSGAKSGSRQRSWPLCSTKGCSAKMYPPSGSSRLCYQHHLAAGGRPSPLVRAGRKAASTSPAPPVRSARPRTILRKKKDLEEQEEPARKQEKPAPPPMPTTIENVGRPPPGSHRDKALDEADKLFNFDSED